MPDTVRRPFDRSWEPLSIAMNLQAARTVRGYSVIDRSYQTTGWWFLKIKHRMLPHGVHNGMQICS